MNKSKKIIKSQMIIFAASIATPALFLCGEVKYSGTLNLEGPSFQIDLNEDGIMDVTSQWQFLGGGSGYSVSAYEMIPSRNTRYLTSTYLLIPNGTPHPGYCQPLINGFAVIPETASTNMMWSYGQNDAMLWTSTLIDETGITQNYSGAWNGLAHAFLGVEITVESNRYYGYVQFSTDKQNNITLVDYGIEQEPWAAPIFYDSCNERISSWFLSSAAAPREWVPLLVGAEGGPFRSMARCA